MENSTNKKTKIVYLINQFHMHGGVQRMISNKIDAWIDHYGYEVTVITINQENKEIVYPPKNTFKLIDLGIKNANKQQIKDVFTFISQLQKVLKQEQPDLVITTLTGIPSLLLPFIQPKIRKVLEIHSSGALSVTKSWKYKWRFLSRYHKVVLLNEDEKQYYKLKNLTVIPNFIEIAYESSISYEDKPKRIVAAGRIHPDKQYEHLIKIWERIFKNYPDWKLEIYGNGDGKLLEKFNKYIYTNNLKNIEFKPATNQLEEILNQSSLFVLTSDTECFPMVLVECKNAKLPAVSYDSPNGPRHIISDDGILIAHNNWEKFAEELSNLMENKTARNQLSENAFRNRIQFSSQVIIKKWNELI